uniref:Uncharacterized protein n=1 Tax=Triticum urartu TaxID=4572 RepID=A0A8R7PIT8_TRIUA
MKRNRDILPVSGNQDGKQIHKDPLKGRQEEVKISWLWLLLRLQFHLRMHHLGLDPNCKVKHKENGSKKMACDAELLPHDPGKRISIAMHSMNYQGAPQKVHAQRAMSTLSPLFSGEARRCISYKIKGNLQTVHTGVG